MPSLHEECQEIIDSWINGNKKQMIVQINRMGVCTFAEWAKNNSDIIDDKLKIKIYEHYLIYA